MISSLLSDLLTLKFLNLISGSVSMTTCKIFLFSPLTIALIEPLTGDQILILSLYLSNKIQSPARTISDSLTASLGVRL